MAIKHIIVLFVETPRKFITAVINLRGVSTNKTIIIFVLFSSYTSQASFIDRARSTAEKFHIFGSVHAMKTEIPPFDSEIKYQLVPNDSDSQILTL
jgi:hypothetical protein